MATTESPKLSIKLWLSSPTYRFSEPTPPQLNLTVSSNCDKPLTVFTWGTFLWPKLPLSQRNFIITDLTDGCEFAQQSIQIQRMAFTRIRGSVDEDYYLTIHPGTPVTVSTPFGRNSTVRPQPKVIASEDGSSMSKVTKSKYAVALRLVA